MAFIPRAGVDISTDYLYYLLKARRWDTGGNKAVKGLTLNKATLSSVKVCIHSAEEQRLIVNILDKLKSVIKRRQSQLAKLDKLVKCRFVEMCGDPVTNPMNWNVCKLVNACTKLTDGTHSSPENLPEGDFKYVTAKNIKRHGFDFSEITYINEKVHQGIYARCNPEY